MMPKAMVWAAGLIFAAAMTGCRVHVDKDANGVEKNVQVDTPFGGVHVNTDHITASDLGLPVYPGADQVATDDKHKSADVHLGFGEWQMRVKAVTYTSADSQDQVAAFYKKALSRYGDVLTCRNQQAVGTPTTTAEGLTCSDDSGKNVNVNVDADGNHDKGFHYSVHDGLEMKAGSKRHQHIVSVQDHKENGKTVFALMALDLPAFVESKGGKSD